MFYVLLLTVAVTLLILAATLVFIGKYYWGPSGPPDRAEQTRRKRRR